MDGNQGPDVVPAASGGTGFRRAGHDGGSFTAAVELVTAVPAATDSAGTDRPDPGTRRRQIRHRRRTGPACRGFRPPPAPRAGRRRHARREARRRDRRADRPRPARIPRQGRPAPGPGQGPRHRNAAHPRGAGNRGTQRMARHADRARNRLPDRRGPGRRRRAPRRRHRHPRRATATGPWSPRRGPPRTGSTPAPSPSAPRTPPPNGTSASAPPPTPWPASPPCCPSPRASPSTPP